MTAAEHTWQALEITCGTHEDPPEFTEPRHKVLARIVYKALMIYECESVTYLSLPGVKYQRTLLRAGDSPATAPPPPAIPRSGVSDLTESSAILAWLADREFASRVGLGVVEVDTAPIGNATAHTQRLLATSQTPSYRSNPTPHPIGDFLEQVADRPHALAVVAERGDDDTIELAIRFVDFTPARQVYTRDELAATDTADTVSVASAFDRYDTMTNWALPEQNGWERVTKVSHSDPSQPLLRQKLSLDWTDREVRAAMDLATSKREYAQLWRRSPKDPLASEYAAFGVTGRLTPGKDNLSLFYPIPTQPLPESVWNEPTGRAPVHITPVLPIQVPDGMTAADTDPTATAPRQKKWSGEQELPALGKAVVRWCLMQGVNVTLSETSIPDAPFVVCLPDGTRNVVSLYQPTNTIKASLIMAASAAHRREDLDGLWVFTHSTSDGKEAFHTLLEPFQVSESNDTQLYRQTSPLRCEQSIAVRPAATPPEQWVVTPTNELQCRIDGDVVARGSLSDPDTAFVSQLPAVSRIDGTITVTQPTGEHVAQFDSPAAFHDAYNNIFPPARPPTLATGLETATVFHKDGPDFQEVRVNRRWQKDRLEDLTQAAMVAFFTTYTVSKAGTTISERPFMRKFLSYFRHQTNKRFIYHKKSTLQSRHSDADPLSDRTWRYQPV